MKFHFRRHTTTTFVEVFRQSLKWTKDIRFTECIMNRVFSTCWSQTSLLLKSEPKSYWSIIRPISTSKYNVSTLFGSETLHLQVPVRSSMRRLSVDLKFRKVESQVTRRVICVSSSSFTFHYSLQWIRTLPTSFITFSSKRLNSTRDKSRRIIKTGRLYYIQVKLFLLVIRLINWFNVCLSLFLFLFFL